MKTCFNKQCNKEISNSGWKNVFAGQEIFTCSVGCYMFTDLYFKYPKLGDFKLELKGYHPRWIAEMKPFLDGFEFDNEEPVKQEVVKKTFWTTIKNYFKSK